MSNDDQKRQAFDFNHPNSRTPTAALRLDATCELGARSSDDTNTAPVRMRARTGDSIDHWYWGKISHDLDGFSLTGDKSKISLLYNHEEPVGYALRKHITTDNGELEVSGTLVQTRNSNRATDLIDWMAAGIPFEASISFAGGSPRLEIVQDGETSDVNGRQFDGPGVIVRKWDLREVSFVTSGADGDTESALLTSQDSVSVEFTKGKNDMSNQTKAATTNEDVAFATASVELVGDLDSTEDVVATATQSVDVQKMTAFDVLKPYRDLGPEGLSFAAEGLSVEDATIRVLQAHVATIEKLEEENKALRAIGGGEQEPASVSLGEPGTEDKTSRFPPARTVSDSRKRRPSRD